MAKHRSKPWHKLACDQKWKCFYCKEDMVKARGYKRSATLEHRVPQSKLPIDFVLGKWKIVQPIGNEVAACSECNNRKGDMDEATFRKLLGKGII